MGKLFILFVLALAPLGARAMDHRGQFGAGAALGANFPSPIGLEEFRNRVGVKLPAFSAWARYIPGTPEVGTELSYNYLALSKQDLQSHAFVFSFISRQNPWGDFHPYYAFGIGWATTDNFYASGDYDSAIFKLTAGIDFELNESTDLGFHLNHFTILKRQRDGDFHTHVLAPVIAINHYFGEPEPLPPPPPPPAPPKSAAPPPSAPPAAAPAQAAPKKAVKKPSRPRKAPAKKKSGSR